MRRLCSLGICLLVLVCAIAILCRALTLSRSRPRPALAPVRYLKYGESLPLDSVTCVAENSSSGEVLIGSESDGICLLNKSGTQTISLSRSAISPSAIPNPARRLENFGEQADSVGLATALEPNGFWVGTNVGVFLVEDRIVHDVTGGLPPTWTQPQWTNATVLPFHFVTALYRTSNGVLYVGTRNSGLLACNSKAGPWRLLNKTPDQNQWVTAIAESDGQVFANIFGLGIVRVLVRSVEHIPIESDETRQQKIRTMAVDRHGRVWVGGDFGVVPLIMKGGVLRSWAEGVAASESVVLSEGNHLLLSDPFGTIWALAGTSVSWFSGTKWCNMDLTGCTHGEIRLLYFSPNEHVWVADEKGLSCWSWEVWRELMERQKGSQNTRPAAD